MDVTVPATFYLASLGGAALLFGWVAAVRTWRRSGGRTIPGPGRGGMAPPLLGLATVGVSSWVWYALPSPLPWDLGLLVSDTYFLLSILLLAVALALALVSSPRPNGSRLG